METKHVRKTDFYDALTYMETAFSNSPRNSGITK